MRELAAVVSENKNMPPFYFKMALVIEVVGHHTKNKIHSLRSSLVIVQVSFEIAFR